MAILKLERRMWMRVKGHEERHKLALFEVRYHRRDPATDREIDIE
jgi:hypothetical protein